MQCSHLALTQGARACLFHPVQTSAERGAQSERPSSWPPARNGYSKLQDGPAAERLQILPAKHYARRQSKRATSKLDCYPPGAFQLPLAFIVLTPRYLPVIIYSQSNTDKGYQNHDKYIYWPQVTRHGVPGRTATLSSKCIPHAPLLRTRSRKVQ